MLSNGAELLTLPLAHARHAAISIGVRVGSRHERDEEAGITHLLEHMLFRGTAEHPTSYAQNFAFESLGGTLDAATSADATVFSTDVPRDAACDAIRLIAEMFRAPVMAHLTLEKNVVREEILDTLDEDDQLVDADELTARALFGAHPIGRSIGGTLASLDALDEARLRAWHRTHYVGANLVIVVTGAFPDAIHDVVRRELGMLPRGDASQYAPVVGRSAASRVELVKSSGSQVDLRVAFRTPGAHDARATALQMLSRVLDDGMSARVFRTLVEDRGLAYEAFGDLDVYEDTSVLLLGASCRSESAPAALDELLALARNARNVEPHELERVRTRVLFELDLSRDDASAMADFLVGTALYRRTTTLDELAERARRVTLDDLAAVADDVLVPEALSVVAVGRASSAETKKLRASALGFR